MKSLRYTRQTSFISAVKRANYTFGKRFQHLTASQMHGGRRYGIGKSWKQPKAS